MPAVAAIQHGRRHAEALMVDQCIIRRTVGPPGDLDPDTGERAPAPTAIIYGPDVSPHAGKCKVQTYEPHEAKPEAGEHTWTVQRYHVHIPIGGPQIAVDDRIQLVETALDPNLNGRTYRVSGLHHKSLATAQRLLVDEVTA